MRLLLRSRRALTVSTAVVACAGGLAACGDDDKGTTSTAAKAPTQTTVTPGVSTGSDGTVAIEERGPSVIVTTWFDAARKGQPELKCSLESERYQREQYGSTGEACLDDAANTQPQAVWADPVKIMSVKESGDYATAVVQPNAGTPDQATVNLEKTSDTGWQILSFR